jgi:hypothetical protein
MIRIRKVSHQVSSDHGLVYAATSMKMHKNKNKTKTQPIRKKKETRVERKIQKHFAIDDWK